MMLSPDDFAAFFEEAHGSKPFPWQQRLLRHVAEKGAWPSVLDLPTGTGKTAAIDIAVFHLALEAERNTARRAPVRIAFVVDRRLVVDDAFARAKKLGVVLAAPQGPVTTHVAEQLKKLSVDGPALIARRLRGGIPREDDWARTPSQPTVLCSTVDQIGSRLLFRGYGVTDSMKPVHAGLIGADCLILLDEAHLAEPFRQTLEWVQVYQGQHWRKVENAAPWGVTLLTATPGAKPQDGFSLDDEDRSHPVLSQRLNATKPARLIAPAKSMTITKEATEPADEETDGNDKDLIHRATRIVEEVQRAFAHAPSLAIGVVVNRVARARAVFERVQEKIGADEADFLLLIGPARPADRDDIAGQLSPIRTGAKRTLERSLILVATQCIEAGVDIDLDALITEAAPLDALRQRFGRLNRAGRDIVPYAAIVAAKSDISARHDDPVYGKTIRPAWDYLIEAAKKERGEHIVDFGLNAFAVRMEADALSPKADAPVLLPAHLDLLSQTAPIPAADPDIALYLHGPNRQPDSITVVWRADIDPVTQRDNEALRQLLKLIPPRSTEAIGLPLWAVRRWLMKDTKTADILADATTTAPEENERLRPDGGRRQVFRWKGDDERSHWIAPAELRPGDTIIVPASYGGADEYGWNPKCEAAVEDIARKAAKAFAGRRFVVRVAPGLIGVVSDERLADALAGAVSERWRDLRAALVHLDLPQDMLDDLAALDHAKRSKVVAFTELYGRDGEGRLRGMVFVAPFGIENGGETEEGLPNATEDDASGSLAGFPLSLQQHSRDVERKAESFARAASLLPERITDLQFAGYLHDAGKADARFQAWLHYGDPLGADPDDPETILAKSARPLPRTARGASGLPEHWRHEALSVRLARTASCLAKVHDPELVLWLVGVHHGYGRPFFPHSDPAETAPDTGPQSLAFDYGGLDWPTIFARLKARYGVWELARMEAILRLADHRASEDRARENGK